MVTEKSRTEYSARNTTVAMIARVTAILLGFATRVVFTHTLSEDYVGINGLFKDILNVLALSELGVGTAITYALYKPIADGDIEKQKSLMKLYQSFYRIVAVIVLAAGLLVIPFMDVLIIDQPQVGHLTLIYIMYLASSVISYLWIYKKTLIDAHQLSYIGVLYHTLSLVIQNVLQIIVLITTRNFILYLSVQIACTVFNNVCVSRKADKMYPYLRDKRVERLSKEERQGIFQNIRAMLMHKIGDVVVNNTDNLLLSALVGTVSVGKYSNYFLIIGSVRQVLDQMFQGITASVGNMGVEAGRNRIRKIFEASFFMGQWIYGLAAICLYEAVDLFVGLSFGTQYIFASNITLILCLNFYLTGMRQAALVFRDSMGLFWYDRYKSLVEAVINLVVSLILGKYMGTAGVFLGTMVSTVTTSLWVEPYMLYKHRLQAPCRFYFLKYLLYASVTFLLWFLEDLVCGHINGNPWAVCVLRVLLCFMMTNLVYLVLYHRTKEFDLLWKKAVQLVKKYRQDRTGKQKASDREARKRETAYEEGFSEEEKCLLDLLQGELTMQYKNRFPSNWEEFARMAEWHGVLSLLYHSLAEEEQVPDWLRKQTEAVARKTVQQSYHLLFLCRYLIRGLEEAGISVVLLKGVGTAGVYPVPELRKSGDVDLLLLEPEKAAQAGAVLEKLGCTLCERQPSLHHIVYQSPEGIEVELHTMFAEPFDNDRINQYLQKKLEECARHVRRTPVMGVELPVLDTAYHAYELLLHMLQHFLRSGFGLKLLCDWVVFWNRETTTQERNGYLRLVEESGIKGFSDMVTAACMRYLGLREECVEWMELPEGYDVEQFLLEILEAEEFGKSAADRMVALRGSSPLDYVREFHHQMHLNFPKSGRYFVCWPVLWTVTLVRFMRNNSTIRKTSAFAILRKAGKRSVVIEQMRLFKGDKRKK